MENNGSKFIRDYLDGKLTEQQRARLETWYLLKAEEVEDSPNPTDFNVLGSRLWNQIESQMGDQLPSTIHKGRATSFLRSSVVKIGIAATLLIATSTTYLLLKDKEMPKPFLIAKEMDIAPGENKAFLTLSNGTKIDLTDASTGTIASETGLKVTKLSGGTLLYKAAETTKPTEGFNNISTPKGGQYTVVLPDGSKVWLNAGSSLRYPIAFQSGGRAVSLTGEGYFEVAHIDGNKGTVPFTVTVRRSNGQQELVKVLGTHFNINAYDDEPVIKTTLLEGSVRIEAGKGKSAILKPGQQSTFTSGNIQLEKADTEMAVAWKNGDFVFREDLESALRKVARWYDLEVVYDKSAPKDLTLGGWISRNRNLSEILNHIQSTGKVQFKLEGRRVTVFN